MPVEKSAGLVLFRKEDNENKFLLLHYEGGHWGFPKGHIEEKETVKEAAIRETEEETKIINLNFKKGFKEWIKYSYKRERKKHFKVVIYLLAETDQKKVEISHEHIGFKWLSFEDTLEQLTFDNTKQILKQAHQYLKNHNQPNF